MAGEFQIGDVVQLTCGGPEMTVTGDSPTVGYVFCQFFAKDESLRSEQIPAEALTLVRAKDTSPHS